MDDSYGVDLDGPLSHEEGNIVVPEVGVTLTSQNFNRLKQAVDPLAASDEFGIDIFEEVLQFMSILNHISIKFDCF